MGIIPLLDLPANWQNRSVSRHRFQMPVQIMRWGAVLTYRKVRLCFMDLVLYSRGDIGDLGFQTGRPSFRQKQGPWSWSLFVRLLKGVLSGASVTAQSRLLGDRESF